MTEHEAILTEMDRQYEALRDAVIVGPHVLAWRVYETVATGAENTSVQYLSLEQLKAMARKFLARRVEPDADESQAYLDLGSAFSGQLQDRYPLPPAPGQDRAYKKRAALTPEERAWNVEQLRKSGAARIKHADALEAEGLSGGVAA